MSTERPARSRNGPTPFFRAAAGLVFPTVCVACRARPVERIGDGGVCESCWTSLPRKAPKGCIRCDDPLPADAALCGRCEIDPPSFSRLAGALPYRGSARGVLIAFKFRGASFLAPHLARIMVEELAADGGFAEVVPVPATRWSLLRADHAADLLAEAVAKRLKTPFAPRRLKKVRRTERQSGLAADRRRANVRGAFEAAAGVPRRVLLVDDVATSGATARECAAALRSAGARDVHVWCFARASREDEIAEAAERMASGWMRRA